MKYAAYRGSLHQAQPAEDQTCAAALTGQSVIQGAKRYGHDGQDPWYRPGGAAELH